MLTQESHVRGCIPHWSIRSQATKPPGECGRFRDYNRLGASLRNSPLPPAMVLAKVLGGSSSERHARSYEAQELKIPGRYRMVSKGQHPRKPLTRNPRGKWWEEVMTPLAASSSSFSNQSCLLFCTYFFGLPGRGLRDMGTPRARRVRQEEGRGATLPNCGGFLRAPTYQTKP